MRPDPDRVRLAAEALARARADAWARGDRPLAAGRPPGSSSDSSERTRPTVDGSLPPSWSARPRREDPQPFNAALGGLLSARGWRQRAAVGGVFGSWAEIVGPQLAAHTRPESFDDGELVVLADSDAWAAQVRLLAPQLLRRLGEELGAGTVRKVRVRGGSGRQHVRLRAPRESVTTAKIEGGHADKHCPVVAATWRPRDRGAVWA
jgi:predicted nucleic acid-binding Zn ribbon protein